MKAYLQAFVNFEQNDWARLFSMAEFAYNNAKNTSNGHIFFELYCGYHLCVSYEEDFDLRWKSRTMEELSSEPRDLMTVYQQNLHHAQKLWKLAYNKGVIHDATPQAIRSGWVANTLNISGITS